MDQFDREIDLNLLRTMHMLIRTRSVTHAAERLGISQPSVSRSLNRLREIFKDPLLIKSNTGMALTNRAKQLDEPLESWLGATRTLLRTPLQDDPAFFKGTFKIASTDYGVLTVVRPAMQSIIEKAPQIRLEIIPLSRSTLNEMTAGAVDVVITGFDPTPGRAFEKLLYVEDYHCVFRHGHPLSFRSGDSASPLSLEELTRWPHVAAKVMDDDGDPVCGQLAALGRSRRIALHVPYFSAAPHILMACDAIMVMPRRAAAHFSATCALHSVPAPIELETFNYWILWHERTRRDPATCWIIGQMAEAAQKTPPPSA